MEGATYGWRGDRERMEALLKEAMALAGDELDVAGCVICVGRLMSSLLEENRERALVEANEGMDAFRKSGSGLPAPERGLWALLTAVTSDRGASAAEEVRASGVTEHAANRGFVHYTEAVLLGRAGDHAAADAAVAAGDAALGYADFYRHLGRRWLAEAAIADGWGDPATWLREALVDFEDRGQDRLASAVRSLLAKAGAPVPRRREDSSVPPGLRQMGVTDREFEVLGLLGEGLANKEIAERLYLSPRTVERHIANVTVKAGVRTRSELVAFAAKNA
jgi:DNA-binding CsgD family transcriptional regulator